MPALSDVQIAIVMAACRPLQPLQRKAFLQRVAALLQGQPLGDGMVHRACVTAQREFFDAPLSTEYRSLPLAGLRRPARGPEALDH